MGLYILDAVEMFSVVEHVGRHDRGERSDPAIG